MRLICRKTNQTKKQNWCSANARKLPYSFLYFWHCRLVMSFLTKSNGARFKVDLQGPCRKWSNILLKELTIGSTVWFLCFNGIRGLFNAKAILLEEQQWFYLTNNWEDKGVHTFPTGIYPKVNVIVQLKYKLAYYDSAVHRFNHYTTRTLPEALFTVAPSFEKNKLESVLSCPKDCRYHPFYWLLCPELYVIYWPSTEPSIKWCTCVNKRKNSRSGGR